MNDKAAFPENELNSAKPTETSPTVIKKSLYVTAEIINKISAYIQPGVSTENLDKFIWDLFRQQNGIETPLNEEEKVNIYPESPIFSSLKWILVNARLQTALYKKNVPEKL